MLCACAAGDARRSHGGLALRIVRTDCSIQVCSLSRFSLSKVDHPFSATHFLGHCFRLIPASCIFAASAFPVPPLHHWVPSDKAAARFGSRSHSLLGAPRK